MDIHQIDRDSLIWVKPRYDVGDWNAVYDLLKTFFEYEKGDDETEDVFYTSPKLLIRFFKETGLRMKDLIVEDDDGNVIK